MDEGFVDLRRNLHTAGDGSFWPSFTDIMMVVAMIFMIASTALVLRNWDLVRELRATIMAEQQAEEKARSATETSATLEEQLARARRELAELRTRRDLTYVFITHDLEEALFLADTVHVMTTRPGFIKKTLSVKLPRPRNYSMMTSKEFVEMKAELVDAVHQEAVKAFKAGEREMA